MAELKLGDEIVANIDDLRKYYEFMEILECFKSGELAQWMAQNGYIDEANALHSLPKDLSVGQLHLKLYEILNGADSALPLLRDYFEAFDRWMQKQDELNASLDRAIEARDDENLEFEIEKAVAEADNLCKKCYEIAEPLAQNTGSAKEQWGRAKLNFQLSSLAESIKMINLSKQIAFNKRCVARNLEGISAP
ncbi:hypothetical protein [Helicobacter sp. 23-1045]